MQTRRLLQPRSIAVFGASENPSPGRRIIEALDALGFEGGIYPINPRYPEVLGRRCYGDIADIPADVDAIVFCVNHSRVLEPFRQAARHGIGGAVILDGGFAERGDEGKALQAEIAGIAREADMAVCGPNCMGVLSPHQKACLYTSSLVDPAQLAGNVALITQSGSIALGLLTDCRRFGFSHLISAGNEAVTTTADYIDFLADDPNTRVIATFTEAIRDPERYVAALDKAADNGKPVVVLKVGKSARAQHAIVGHTGGLAGTARVVSAMLKRHRAIEVDDMEELTEVLACCQGTRWPVGPRIGVLTGSGGQAELILDICNELSIDLPELSMPGRARAAEVIGPVSGDGNPLDAWGSGDFQANFPHAFTVLEDEDALDSVVMYSDTNDGQPMAPTRYIPFLADASKAGSKPYYYMTTRHGLFRTEFVGALRESGAAILTGIRAGMLAIDRMGRWAAPAAAARTAAPALPADSVARLERARAGGRPINEYAAKRLLEASGLPAVEEAAAATEDGLVAEADRIGYPVVLKIVSDEIPHKTEFGLVDVGIGSADALRLAYRRMRDRLAGLADPPSDAQPVVQTMVSGGVEVFAGVSRDPVFGLTLAFGLGGTLIELIEDVALRALPLREGDAEAMIAETLAGRVLSGVRGRGPSDVAALADVLYRLGDFAWAARDAIDEIDLNPVIVLPEGRGCAIVDALIVPKPLSNTD
ncbi:MAG: acetate--CoA ligase family protein [Rhodospirillaceae bacterium]